MGLPPFFSRVADALRPVTDVDPAVLASKLSDVTVELHLPDMTDTSAVRDAALMAGNLLARLYPTLEVHAAPASSLAREVAALAKTINPDIGLIIVDASGTADVEFEDASATSSSQTDAGALGRQTSATNGTRVALVIGWRAQVQSNEDERPRTGVPPQVPSGRVVHVNASGWVATVDHAEDESVEASPVPGTPLAWLAAAALGVGEMFRAVFADELGSRGRHHAQPGRLSMLPGTAATAVPDGGPPQSEDPRLSARGIDIGHVHLAGAGAIGEAFALALRASEATGRLTVVEPETVTLSNLQRYVLTDAASVDVPKGEIIRNLFAGSDVSVEIEEARWGDRSSHLGVQKVAVALDSARDRIAVTSTLPQAAYNAWTQVADLGWSRHEDFGTAPCLACLYYPSTARPSDHELIAAAIGQPILRVLGYLVYNQPIGFPLPHVPAIPDLPANQEDVLHWIQVPLIDDLLAAGVINEEERDRWAASTVGALYRDGVCAGGVLPVGNLPGEVLVPLAHQSALAGFMLAAEVLTASEELRGERDAAVERRFDVLRGFPQVIARPRERTPGCLCSDPDYVRGAIRLRRPPQTTDS
jgi:hypothetical protein